MAEWGKRNGRVSTEEMLDGENQRMTDNLASKVSRLKGIAFDIETETNNQNKYLNGMDSEFDSSTGLLSGTMVRMSHMIGSGKNNRKLMCYIVLFLVILFIVAYYLITRVTTKV